MTHITPTEHEKAEWSRMAQAHYAAGQNDVGHRYSAAASIPSGAAMPVSRFDMLQSAYRRWLIDGERAEAEHRARLRAELYGDPCEM